ncbi:MAG: bifunctional nuclease family protein, partial [Candidatus Tectomicrobia bacterium]|nr:bifunctional nuclease family protein [Candidatus Tectomicrobia bacterium]
NVRGETVAVDARPSDAIALALKAQAPIYVMDEVLDNAEAMGLTITSAQQEANVDELQDWLKDVKPEDFGDGEEADG